MIPIIGYTKTLLREISNMYVKTFNNLRDCEQQTVNSEPYVYAYKS